MSARLQSTVVDCFVQERVSLGHVDADHQTLELGLLLQEDRVDHAMRSWRGLSEADGRGRDGEDEDEEEGSKDREVSLEFAATPHAPGQSASPHYMGLRG